MLGGEVFVHRSCRVGLTHGDSFEPAGGEIPDGGTLCGDGSGLALVTKLGERTGGFSLRYRGDLSAATVSGASLTN